MFVITEWLERYEVNEKGQPARHGDKLRASRLLYIRSKLHGRSQSAGFYAMQAKAGDRAYEVFGVFQKFLEIAGDSGAIMRGILLNHRGQPATVEDLSHILRVEKTVIIFALEVLTNTDVAWMTEETGVTFQKFLEFQENWSAFLNSTQLEHNTTRTQHNSKEQRTKATSAPQSDTIRQNPTSPTQSDSDSDSKCQNSIEFRLSSLLLQLILLRKADYKKPNLKVWAIHIDRMMRLDKRTPSRIEAVIRWCQKDTFWQTNILSTNKLRKQFDRLEMQMKKGGAHNSPRQQRNLTQQESEYGQTIENV